MKREWSYIVEKILSKEKHVPNLADLLELVNRCVNRLDNPYRNDLDLSNSTESKTKSTSKKKMNFSSIANNSAKETGEALSKNFVIMLKI